MPASVQQHSGEHSEVIGGRKQPGVSGHAPQRPRILVMHAAAQAHARNRVEFGRQHPASQGRAGLETGRAQAQWFGNSRPEIRVQRLAGERFDQTPENQETEVRVHATRTRLHRQRQAPEGIPERRGTIRLPVQRPVSCQAGSVRQQLPHGNPPLQTGLHAGRSREFREEIDDRRVQFDPTPVTKLHDRGGRAHDLGERGNIEHIISAHRPLSGIGVAAGGEPHRDRRAAAGQQDSAGPRPLGNRVSQHCLYPGRRCPHILTLLHTRSRGKPRRKTPVVRGRVSCSGRGKRRKCEPDRFAPSPRPGRGPAPLNPTRPRDYGRRRMRN